MTRHRSLRTAVPMAALIAGLCLSGYAGRASSPAADAAALQDAPEAAPFGPFIHAETDGAVQALAVSDTALVIDVKLPDESHVIKAYSQPSGRLLWEKAYVDVSSHLAGPALHIHGGRLAFHAAETSPSSASIGLHVLDL
ncbi:MAG: hypothetical protein FJY83_06155, partial [Candidatus Aminicenantes bacterium]|nr:hypothetical protein [Candidatus Aminicenantes bacterium]